MIYQWKLPQQFPVDPQVAGERLEQLRVRSNGYLTPKRIVDDSRPPDSPLHACFEWDDADAAERWREQQAGGILRSIVAVIPERPEGKPIRAFVSVRVENQPAYTSTALALGDQALREQILARALIELRAIQHKYRELEELVDVFAALDKLTSDGIA